MSDTNTPNDEARNGTSNGADGNPPASDAQPTTPLTPAPAQQDTQDFQATTPFEPQAFQAPQAPQSPQSPQAPPASRFTPQVPQAAQAPQAPQPPQMPNAPQTPAAPQVPQVQAPGAPQQFDPSAPQAPQQFGPGVPQAPQQFGPGAPGAPQQFGPGAPGAPQAPGVPGYAYATPQPKGLAIAALIIGIVAICSLIFGWIPFLGGGFSIVCGAAAVVLGIIAMNKAQSKGMSITGLITGGIAVLAGIGIIIAWSVFFANAGQALDDYSSSLEDLQSELDTYDYDDYSTDSGTSPDTTGEYSEAFCLAYADYSDLSASSDVTSDDPAARKALEALAAETSPNQDIYQEFLDVTAPGASATPSDVSAATVDLAGALGNDFAGCMDYVY